MNSNTKTLEFIYLDHAATTPCRPEVHEVMYAYARQHFGNPNSIHRQGRDAREVMNRARMRIAGFLGAHADEIVFVSGGTESDNLAIKGAVSANRHRGNHIITCSFEHHAVLECCKTLAEEGCSVSYVHPDTDGLVNPDDVTSLITKDTVMITIMHANNEVGTVQNIAKIVASAKQRKPEILIHTDAVQTVGHLEVNVDALGVDLLSFSAHKFYGPPGIGGLYVRRGVKVRSVNQGGGQEAGFRSGTQAVPLILGMDHALLLAEEEREDMATKIRGLREQLITSLLKVPYSRLNGHRTQRLDNNVNLSFWGIDGEDLTRILDLKNISSSTASACVAIKRDPSHVLAAMGLSPQWACGALRLTLGRNSLNMDVARVVQAVTEAVNDLRSTHFGTPEANK